MKYIVMEMQTWADGSMSTPCYAFDDRNSADAKYYTIMASAAKSSLPMHGVAMLDNTGVCYMSGSYAHDTVEK